MNRKTEDRGCRYRTRQVIISWEMTPVIAEDEWVVFGEEFIDLEHTCQPSCLPKKCSCDFLYPNSYYIELSGASLSNMVNTSHVWLFNLK